MQDDLEKMFEVARQELAGVDSVRAGVQGRIASASMRRGPGAMVCGLAAALLVGVFIGWRFLGTGRPAPAPQLAEDFRMEVGGVELVEHIAALVDNRAVVVVWSYRGQGLKSDGDGVARRIGNYRLIPVREDKLADGRTLVCSIFIPDAGVQPVFEPPSVGAVAGGGVVQFNVVPRTASANDVASAFRGAGGDVDMSGLFDRIQREIH
jgi:hypothetical protein